MIGKELRHIHNRHVHYWCRSSSRIGKHMIRQYMFSSSQSFGTCNMCGVRHWLLRVYTVYVHLQQNGNIYKNLQEATDRKLEWSLVENKVSGLKGIATCPHQYHFDAHSFCRVILVIPIKLWNSKQSLSKYCKKAQGFYIEHRVQR